MDPMNRKSDSPCILSSQLQDYSASCIRERPHSQDGVVALDMQETEAETEAFGYTKSPKLR